MKQRQPKDLVGKKWDRLKVIKLIGLISRSFHWECACVCGKTTRLRTSQINKRSVKSCGCLAKEVTSARLRSYGEGRSSLAAVWRAMVSRCHNPNNKSFSRYGAKGISVCRRWRSSFLNFKNDMGKRPPKTQLDRFPDKNGDYKPGNVRWATSKQNQRNRSNNILLTVEGQTKTMIEWAEEKGLKYGTVWSRLRLGWSPEEAVNTPKRGKREP